MHTHLQTAQRPVVALEPGEGEDVWFLDNLLTVKARPAEGAPFGVVESRMPEGSRTPFHRHEAEDEAFYVIEGRMRVLLEGGRTLEAGPGTYVHVPVGVAHGFVTLSPVRMLVLCGDRGFVEMSREAGQPAERHELPPAGPPDIERLERACARHGIDLLGPLPE